MTISARDIRLSVLLGDCFKKFWRQALKRHFWPCVLP